MSKEKQRELDEMNRPINEQLFNNLQNQYQELAKVKAESEQIEEMAHIISNSIMTWANELPPISNPHFVANALYNADYRKQSENTVELPCKVGTTLYFLYNSPYADRPDLIPRIYKTADWYFEVDKTGIVINTSDIHSFNKKYDYHLGETVFLTQEEAEEALAKMKGR